MKSISFAAYYVALARWYSTIFVRLQRFICSFKEKMMERAKNEKTPANFKMVGDWKDQSKQLKTNYSQLTDADLKYEEGKENELLDRVGSRLHKNRDEVIGILKKGQPEKK